MREGEKRIDVLEEEGDNQAFSPYGLTGGISQVFFSLLVSCGSQNSSPLPLSVIHLTCFSYQLFSYWYTVLLTRSDVQDWIILKRNICAPNIIWDLLDALRFHVTIFCIIVCRGYLIPYGQYNEFLWAILSYRTVHRHCTYDAAVPANGWSEELNWFSVWHIILYILDQHYLCFFFILIC